MPFIKFTQPAEVRAGSDDGCKVLKSWKAGQVVELSSAACQYWLNRNMAKKVQGKTRPTPPPVVEEPKAEPETEPKKEVAEAKSEASEAAPSSSAPPVLRSRRGRPRKSAVKPSSSS